jgi:hypothetical protein
MDTNENQEVEVQNESSLANDFNADAFMTEGNTMELSSDEQAIAEEQSEVVETEEVNEIESNEQNETEIEETETTDWSLDSKVETDSEGSTEDGTIETTESNSEDNNDSWKEIATKLNIDAEDYDAFIETLERQKTLAQTGATNEKINELGQLISLEDEQLVRKELQARGFNPDEVEDELDIMIENNTIRSEARKVRKDLESVIDVERNAVLNQTEQLDATQQAEIEDAENELKDYMSKTNEMFGGRINSKQQEEHVGYISNDFFDEITADVQNMAEAAWLWKYRGQILKGMKTKGVEQGKAAILDKMVNPETTRKTAIPDPETGEFNPNRFMDSEQM